MNLFKRLFGKKPLKKKEQPFSSKSFVNSYAHSSGIVDDSPYIGLYNNIPEILNDNHSQTNDESVSFGGGDFGGGGASSDWSGSDSSSSYDSGGSDSGSSDCGSISD